MAKKAAAPSGGANCIIFKKVVINMLTPQAHVPSRLFQGYSFHSPQREPSCFSRTFPTLSCYAGVLVEALRLHYAARQGTCDDMAWTRGSEGIFHNLLRVGCSVHIEGLENLAAMHEPCVFIGNHMSTLDAFGLPAIIRPFMPVTPVVKRSLCTMPFFGPIMRSREPIPVDRVNPREDFKAVMEGGTKHLANGISMIVFPQSTRSTVFDPAKFNTIGIKLAKHANVPIIPMALKTDAWGQGKYTKDLGAINPALPIHFRFGKALRVQGNGKEEHASIIQFIQQSLDEWQ
jgi:1-acyl-sn-glycerol-3-phosphate acyltransferase